MFEPSSPAPSAPMGNSYSTEWTQQRTLWSIYYYHKHWYIFQKVKQTTNRHPPQVLPLTITARLITIVNCIHKQVISKMNINQYEFLSQQNQKLNKKKQKISPIPQFPHIPSWMYRRQSLDRRLCMQKLAKHRK